MPRINFRVTDSPPSEDDTENMDVENGSELVSSPVYHQTAPDEDGEEEIDVEEDEDTHYDQADEDESSLKPRLKIKLKLPVVPPSSASNPATPVSEEVRSQPKKQRLAATRSRRRIQDAGLESPDDEEDEYDDEQQVSRSPSTAAMPGPAKKRPLTARQAVLASVADPSHVSLDDDGSMQPSNSKGRKKQLNETELALRREETARKRRNLTEKKLEDEKAETINRLLKKQSRPKGKRLAAASNAAPSPSLQASSKPTREGTPGEEEDAMDVDEDIIAARSPPPAPVPPSMYRWVSTSRSGSDAEKHMILSFSVPPSVLHDDELSKVVLPPSMPLPRPACDVDGCRSERRYRLVSDWSRGACGLAHLKILEGTAMQVV